MIADLLPAYQRNRQDNYSYATIKSSVIDGHEVAWMKVVRQGDSGPEDALLSNSLYCECDFKISDRGEPSRCRYRSAVVHLWQLALRDEYIQRYAHEGRGSHQSLIDHFKDIVLDLMQKRLNGEFVDGFSSGLWIYGGLFYRQSLEVITGLDDRFYIHPLVQEMERDKQLLMDGAVVLPYRQYTPSSELKEEIVTPDGWTGQLYFYTCWSEGLLYRWRFQVIRPDGSEVFDPTPTEVPDLEWDDTDEMMIILREHIIQAKELEEVPQS